MNDFLQQLLSMGPAIGAGVAGNGNAMQAFMDGYQKTMAQLQQQARLKQTDQRAEEDRQRLLERQKLSDQRTEQDRAAADQQRLFTLGKMLNEVGGNAETLPQAEGAIDSTFGLLTPEQQAKLAPMRDQALRGVATQVTNRQKGELRRWVNDELLKSELVAKHADTDFEVTQAMPARIRQIAESLTGQAAFKKSDLLSLTESLEPARKPSEDVSLQSKEVMVNGKLTLANYNPKTDTYTDQQGKPVVVDAVPPKPSNGTDPEIADLRKELLRLQVENASTPKEPNQSQFTAAGYAGRMEQAEPILAAVTPAISGMSLPKFELQTNSWFARPTFQSPQVQSYMQAARNFINAVLRRESGAVISPAEFTEAKAQYLPIPGDTPESLKQKADNRAYVFQNMKRSSGKAYEPPPAPPPPVKPMTPVASHAPTGAKPASQTNAQGKKAAVKGERRVVNGVLREWSGVKWEKVQM